MSSKNFVGDRIALLRERLAQPRPPSQYRVTVALGRTVHGAWRMDYVPTFVLDADIHGLSSEREAEEFAERMISELAGEGSCASACAVAI